MLNTRYLKARLSKELLDATSCFDSIPLLALSEMPKITERHALEWDIEWELLTGKPST